MKFAEVDANKENACPALSYEMVSLSNLEAAGIGLKRRWNQDENQAATDALKKGSMMSKDSHGSSLRGLCSSSLGLQAFGKGRSKPIPQMTAGRRGKILPLVEDGGRVYRRRGQPREPDGPAKPHIYKVDENKTLNEGKEEKDWREGVRLRADFPLAQRADSRNTSTLLFYLLFRLIT